MYNNFQQPPAYGSVPNDPYAQPIYSNQYEQIPYVDNTYMNQQSPPIYQGMPEQSPQIYQGMSQQPPPIYQTMPQQPPPTYATAVQSQPYSAPVQQQQPTSSNSNSSANTPRPPGTPFSEGYKWPRKSMPLVCPQCGATVTTRVETSVTGITIIGVVILCIFTCILGLLPLCIPACKRSTHYCPYCNSVLGIRRPLR